MSSEADEAIERRSPTEETRADHAWRRSLRRSWKLDSRATVLSWHCEPRPWAITTPAAGRRGRWRNRYLRPTHFISVPLTSSPLVERFEELRSSIMRQQQLGDTGYVNSGIEESIFMSAGKLHLTLLILCLPSNLQLESARRLLASLQPHFQQLIESLFLHHPPDGSGCAALELQFSGLRSMQEDATRSRVVYGEPRNDTPGVNILREISKLTIQSFVDAKLLQASEQRQFLDACGNICTKFHATFLNSKYRLPKTKRRHFDASRILSEFGDIDLGVQTLQEVQLNEMSSTAPNGYYRTECKVQLGGNDPNQNDTTLDFKDEPL